MIWKIATTELPRNICIEYVTASQSFMATVTPSWLPPNKQCHREVQRVLKSTNARRFLANVKPNYDQDLIWFDLKNQRHRDRYFPDILRSDIAFLCRHLSVRHGIFRCEQRGTKILVWNPRNNNWISKARASMANVWAYSPRQVPEDKLRAKITKACPWMMRIVDGYGLRDPTLPFKIWKTSRKSHPGSHIKPPRATGLFSPYI